MIYEYILMLAMPSPTSLLHAASLPHPGLQKQELLSYNYNLSCKLFQNFPDEWPVGMQESVTLWNRVQVYEAVDVALRVGSSGWVSARRKVLPCATTLSFEPASTTKFSEDEYVHSLQYLVGMYHHFLVIT